MQRQTCISSSPSTSGQAAVLSEQVQPLYILKHIYMMSLRAAAVSVVTAFHVTKGTAESCDTFDSCKEATPRSLIRSHTFCNAAINAQNPRATSHFVT